MEEKYLRPAARILSAVFTPFYVPTVGFIALFLFTYLGMLQWRYQLIIVGVVYLFTVVLPMAAIYFYQKVNGWSLRHLSNKERRVVPYAMTIVSYVICLLLMYRMGIPRFMSGILVSSLLAMMVCATVNIWWKISAHMTMRLLRCVIFLISNPFFLATYRIILEKSRIFVYRIRVKPK